MIAVGRLPARVRPGWLFAFIIAGGLVGCSEPGPSEPAAPETPVGSEEVSSPPPIPDAPDDAEPTVGEPIVFEGTESEWFVAYVGCLNDAGWEASVVDDPFEGETMQVVNPPGQEEAFRAVLAECDATVGQLPIPPVTEENAKIAYEASLTDYECLVSQGMSMPEPPSFEAYWGDYQQYQGPPWNPFADAARNPGYRDVVTACRQ